MSDSTDRVSQQQHHHATGPRTAAGKQRSAANAIKHGLSGRTLIVRDDEHDDHAAFLAEWELDMQPAGAAEREVFAQLIHAAWQLRRIARAEAELIDESLDDPLHSDAAQAKLRLYSIYQGRAERAFHKALAALRQLQEERLFREAHPRLNSAAEAASASAIPKLPRLAHIRRELERDKRTETQAHIAAVMQFATAPPPTSPRL